MKVLGYTLLMVSLVFTLGGCATDSAEEPAATPAGATPASAGSAGAAPAGAAPAAERSAATPPAPPAVPPPPAPPRRFAVPAGTEVSIILTDALSSGKNQAGDQFQASLAAPIVIDGQTVVDRGAKVQGRVVDAESSGRVS